MSGFEYVLNGAAIGELEELNRLETESFPPDEAASKESVAYRITEAGDFFYTYRRSPADEIVGFVNGTCTVGSVIEEESMTEHKPEGNVLVIHSVTVSQNHRRNGLGSSMLKRYVQQIKENRRVDGILLLCKANLLSFYVGCGFSLVGLSHVVHGQNPWFEMQLDLLDARCVEQVQVDAFAATAFSGNPAAVVFEHRDAAWMQNVAMENNLAETSFLSLLQPASYSLRWFTPNKEVDLCGHATLAAAHALYETKRVPPLQRIDFHTLKSGLLTAQGKADGTIEMDFPATLPVPSEGPLLAERRRWVEAAFGLKGGDILYIGSSIYDVLVEVSRPAFAALKSRRIDFAAVAAMGGRGVLVTCLGGARESPESAESDLMNDQRYDFLSRCFFPIYGIDEDPVTGSAHCALTPYWASKLTGEEGQTLTALQASSRGGVLRVTMKGDRVLLAGPSVTTMKTKLMV
ncbi:hypothetical protein B484DRAFT_332161 [Ochromonadaceae sp. CCMP2298]|nr:hypothetical protein B484DRAFT_332161 [Ochromonadaceae sp. CCMP2298]|mmetsp:Transcript_22195/g.49366  ORF Transcript_22195/g.49366 Transcript_22195/m.49366 type:complete len:461 (+) Transcript_22195:62-1444(+)